MDMFSRTTDRTETPMLAISPWKKKCNGYHGQKPLKRKMLVDGAKS
jgi:hypothetical protein